MIQYGLASSDASPPRTYASLVASLSPIAWWRSFSGATWTDASGNGYHATLIGNPSIVTGIPGAAADGAVSLDGRLIDYASIRMAAALLEKAAQIPP